MIRFFSFFAGILVNSALMYATSFLPLLYSIGSWVVILGYFGVGGLIHIPIGHKGVPLFLEGRWRLFELREGWSWILPRPLMAAEAVDVRERTTLVKNFTGITEDGAQVSIDAAIQWAVTNPFQSLSVGEEVIAQGMEALIKRVLRQSVRERELEVMLAAYEDVETVLENAADAKAGDWGVDIRNVIVSVIDPSKEVLADSEKRKREEYQREAEATEAGHVITQIGRISRELGIPASEAKDIFQVERTKATRNILDFKIGAGPEVGGIVQALADWLRRRRRR